MKELTYIERVNYAKHPLSQRLFQLMEQKKTNLGLAADVTTQNELIDLIHQTGDALCILKTHIDILADFHPRFISTLKNLAEQYQFVIFEDRKFADIGQTVRSQYAGGVYRIAEWAHLTNAHLLPGPGIIEGLKTVRDAQLEKNSQDQRGLLLLAQMSSSQNLLDEKYTQKNVEYAKQYSDFVMGFIAQEKITEDPGFLHLTPGVQLHHQSDPLGQRYVTPEHVIFNKKSDIILVGRGITQASNPAKAAEMYRAAGWEAYQKRLCEN